MRKAVRNNFISHSRTKKRKQLWKRIVSMMGVVVVFCTVYALVLPAITLSGDPVCGKAIHAHTDDCYRTAYQVLECAAAEHQHDGCEDEWGNLTCGYGQVLLHTHNALCRDASGALICKLEERQEHFHSEDCFQKDTLLLCQQEESPSHSHDDSCYEIARELTCELAEQEGHTHGADCKETEQQLICEQDHEHTDECYETVETLVCTLEETEGHAHGEQCYQENKTLTCTQEEIQGHTHTEQCYQVTETLTCTEEEVGPHTHSKDCYDEKGDRICGITAAVVHVHDKNCFRTVELEEPELICTIPEHAHEDACFEKQDGMSADQYEYLCGFGEHVHSENCYDENEELICNVPEHTHDAACRGTDQSGTANKETPADWEKSMAQVELTGDWRKDLLSVARTQVGYQESKSNVRQNSDGTVRGYTRYGQWAEKPYSDWNTLFVGFCMEYAAAKGIPVEADCAKWVEALRAEEIDLYAPYNAETVSSGDLVFIDTDEDGAADQAAIIAEIIRPADQSKVSLKVVSGDVNDKVDYVSYELSDPQLIGYLDLAKAQMKHEANYTLERVYRDEDVTVTVSFRPTANIPEDAVLVVKKIDSEAQPEAYEDHYRQATELLGENATANIQNFQLYDISFRNGDQEITPAEAVKVDIRYTADEAVTQDSSISIIHYAEDGLEKPADVSSQVDEEGNVEVNFTTGSFSVYAVVAAADEEIGPFDVLFDGALGRQRYQGSNNYKYDGAERRLVETDVYGYVVLPQVLSSTSNYNYRVKGWYDVGTDTYYGSEMLGKTIKVTADSVFYPDYVAASYDIAHPNDTVTNQPDVRDFITTHVFDYNELFNIHSASYTGDLSDLYSTNRWTQDNDKAGSMGFLFTDWVNSGNIGRPNDLDDVNMQHSNGERGEHTNFAGTITPGVGNQTRWNALFTTNDDFIGREYLGEGDWLFSYNNDTGYYYYNSALNAAGYNQSEERFYVYNHTETVDNAATLHDFLPLNYGQREYEERNTVVNFWFGMKNEIQFYLPEDSGSAKNVSATGDDLEFRFSGDDDVWVFVDGQLILDLGGVHDIVYGEINFAKGTYTIGNDGAENTAYLNDGMPGTVVGEEGVTTGNLPRFAGGQEHTLTVYYLERGASLSNCAMYFNIAPQYELEFVKRDEDGEHFLEGAVFQVYEDPECTIVSDLYEVDPTTGDLTPRDSFTTKADGSVVCKALLAGRKYYIKEIAAPPGYPDMSEYVIQLDFSINGVPTVVVLNSNGDEWIFADSYMFDNLGRRVILNVYDSKYVGGEKELYVEKVWADGNENHTGEEVVIRLYANGEFTDRYLRLNSENDWKGTFYHLPTEDDDGNPYDYTVQEETTTGYRVSYEYLDEQQSSTETSGEWVKVSAITPGKDYMFVHNNNALASTAGGIAWANARIAMQSGPDGNASSWYATTRGSGYNFYSGTGRYMLFNYSSWDTSARVITTGTSAGSYALVYNTNNQGLYAHYSNTRMYYITGINGTAETATVDTIVANALKFDLYEWEETSIESTTHFIGWKVTNTPIEKTQSVTVNKHWDNNVSQGARVPMNVTLYSGKQNADGIVTDLLAVATGTLSEANGWTYVFDELTQLEDGFHYYLVENTNDFDVSYGNAPTVTLQIDDSSVTAARVEFSDQDPLTVTMNVTNKATTVNFPVDKYWGMTVSDEVIQDVTVSLYSYNETTGEVLKVRTVVLGDANGWHSEFVNVPRLPDGSFYFVWEETPGYQVEYEWPETVVIDNVPTTVGLVKYYDNGAPVEIYILNEVQFELPATGGPGIMLYTSGGILLLTAAAFILLYNHTSKRRRGERSSP